MAKFLFIFRQPPDFTPTKLTPEEMQQLAQKWQAWMAEGLQKGWMVQAGERLTLEGRVVNAKKAVTDGPFVESKEIVAGYSFIQADTIDAAAEIAKDCPGLLTGFSVEIRPFADFSAKKQ